MFLTGNYVSVLERPAAKKYVHSERFKSPYPNITAKSKAANPKLQLDNQSFLSNNNNVLIPSNPNESTSNSIGNLITKCNEIFYKHDMICYSYKPTS